MTEPVRAVVLLSGGLDSTTVLALAASEGRETYALSFRYGQRHEVELESAARQAARFGARAHEVVDLAHLGRLVAAGTSLLQASSAAVPKDSQPVAGEIPSTYVPARNTLFLAYALGWAEVLGAGEIWVGVNAVDYSGYPDCRPEFLAAFERLAAEATRAGVEGKPLRVRAPLIDWSKRQIIEAGQAAGVDYADTVSCYDPRVEDDRPRACGRCESCRLRRDGFVAAGVEDPTRYV
ncbi:7-cyano-7-deazaguanine synthase QueC [Nannocystis bainbridge]|uniref:7-cyano-7-deazaguanine synthase n=1 Tax=Nannocystis bainbridge TaxID=2995303 RepID=A0ABT5DVX2_9BACT|nr:7-cyano-7-deazaguanine synthase QueC [Nannocystis bainbridge]MDC0717787.1 7-cyano-7-deazaguanine synthase QueC [Nannocystis bainbridge]